MVDLTGNIENRDLLFRLSELKKEPDWMKVQRLECWSRFRELSYPSRKEENWRRSHPEQFIPNGNVRYYSAAGTEFAPIPRIEAILGKRIDHLIMQHGLYAQLDSEPVFAHISPLYNSKGVVFYSMEQAVRHYPELVKEYFLETCIYRDWTKFRALHGALWSGGYFLYVPRNMKITIPLKAYFVIESEGLFLAPHNMVVLAEGAEVTLIEEYSSRNPGKKALVQGITEVHQKAGSRLQLLSIHNWGRKVNEFFTKSAYLESDAELEWFSANTGGNYSRSEIYTDLREPGSEARLYGVYVADDQQRVELLVDTYHGSPRTEANINFKGALRDKSRSVFQGLIRIPLHAKGTNSRMENRNLLLSRKARADSIPKLEIENNEVQASHASATSNVDDEQLYYLCSRGLSEDEAEKVIISGFFEQLIHQLKHPGIEERVREIVQSKLA